MGAGRRSEGCGGPSARGERGAPARTLREGPGALPTHLRLPCRGTQLTCPAHGVRGACCREPATGGVPGRARGWRGRQLRAAPAAALALPPVGQGRLAARACPQCPPRLRLRGLAGGTCTGGRWGGEVRTPVPAAGQPPARPPLPSSFRVARRLGASRHVRSTAGETSRFLLLPKDSPRWKRC